MICLADICQIILDILFQNQQPRSSGNSSEKFRIICKRRTTIFIISTAYVNFLLDFLLSISIYNSIVKDAMYSVKFPTNLWNSLSPCLFLAPQAFAPRLRFHTIRRHRRRHLRRYLRPQCLHLRPEKSPLQSQNIYLFNCNRISGLT